MEPIHIDLRNLSQEHLAQCKPHCVPLGEGRYDLPCVIGTLMSPEVRTDIQKKYGETCVEAHVKEGVFSFPEGQADIADRMQQAFDKGNWPEVERIAAKYIAAPAPIKEPANA